VKRFQGFLKNCVNGALGNAGLVIRRIQRPDLKFPAEATDFQRGVIRKALKYSMTDEIRMWALIQAFEHVDSKKVLGDFVECGVWSGGNLILLSSLQNSKSGNRAIYGFDTFLGMTKPGEFDIDYRGHTASRMMAESEKIDGLFSIHAFASRDLVEKNLRESGATHIRLIQGDVVDTLMVRENLPNRISILRLDTDWYESTKIELETLYPLLEPGGVLIIDDYGHFKGSQKAVDEFFRNQKPWMHHVDYACRLIIKE